MAEQQPSPLSAEDIEAIRSEVENLLQVPAVGRIVHYVSHGTPVRADGSQAYASTCRAAIITGVYFSDRELTQLVAQVDLAVLNPTGMFFNEHVHHDEDGKSGGTWHWPERV